MPKEAIDISVNMFHRVHLSAQHNSQNNEQFL